MSNGIPLKIWQTWSTKNLPKFMQLNLENLKRQNPEFEYNLFDDIECENFIRDNFSQEVFYAFKTLVPGAYKADLWRCCVLYIHGGIYLDIKFRCYKNFKLLTLTDKEHFCYDRAEHFPGSFGLYNAIMICKPKTSFLKDAIDTIVKNVKTFHYGLNPLYVTGPGMLGLIYEKHYSDRNNIDINNLASCTEIENKGKKIMEHYPEYRSEQGRTIGYKNYDLFWKQRAIFEKINLLNEMELNFEEDKIPLNLFNIWHDTNMPPFMIQNIEKLKKDNEEFNHRLFTFSVSDLSFLNEDFTAEVFETFENLIPRAYKSDFLRYCILYVYGGVYMDVKFRCFQNFKLVEIIGKEHYCLDLQNFKTGAFSKDGINEYDGIYNGIIIVKRRNKLMLNAIYQIVQNVKNKHYGPDWLAPTGPILLGYLYHKIYKDGYIYYPNKDRGERNNSFKKYKNRHYF